MKLHENVAVQHAFVLANGKNAQNVHELHAHLQVAEERVFQHHVTPAKNDFSAWVKDMYGRHDLAAALGACTSRQATLETLQWWMSEEKIQKQEAHATVTPPKMRIEKDVPKGPNQEPGHPQKTGFVPNFLGMDLYRLSKIHLPKKEENLLEGLQKSTTLKYDTPAKKKLVTLMGVRDQKIIIKQMKEVYQA